MTAGRGNDDRRLFALVAARVLEAATLVRDIVADLLSWVATGVRAILARPMDLALALFAGAALAAIAIHHWRMLDPRALMVMFDLWFEADIPRVVESLISRDSPLHYRTSVHPMTSLLLSGPAMLLRQLGMSTMTIAATYVGSAAFALGALAFATFRGLGVRRPDALLLCLAFPATAAGLFWMAVPETYVWGAVSILVPFGWLALPRGAHDRWSGPLQSAASLSITATNWVTGLAASLMALGARPALRHALLGFLAIALLTPVQSAIFPRAGQFLNFKAEVIYTVVDGRKAKPEPLDRLTGMFRSSLVAPTPVVEAQPDPRAPWKLSMRAAQHGPGLLGNIAWAGWVVLIGLGLWSARGGRIASPLVAALLLAVAFDIVLHMVYGEDVFLFSMHFVAKYLIVIAWGLAGPWRRPVLALLLGTVAASYAANVAQFEAAAAAVNSGRYTTDSGLTPYLTAHLDD